jgi:transcriptional regulator with PAS, ATPase and Fis domain
MSARYTESGSPFKPMTEQGMLLGDQTVVTTAMHDPFQNFPEVIGRSQSLLNVLEAVTKVAASDSSVLVLGESGTGKELIAYAIHRLSKRSHRRFIPINCSAIPDTLLESELFGYEKGAYTGADKRRIGHFEAATGGTIFLDEIGDMPPSLQAKLLRVLQDKRYTPLGGSQSKSADVRIIAATNKHLENAVEEGSFRLDLFYRLNVLPIKIPPLRERLSDIPELLTHFIDSAQRLQNIQSPVCFSKESVEVLKEYDWPGNIRQLQNLVDRLVVLKGGGVIQVSDLPKEFSQERAAKSPAQGVSTRSQAPATVYPKDHAVLPDEGINLTEYIESLENGYIRQALHRTGNNKNRAAKLLGLNRTTLVERIKKRRIQPLNAPSEEL